MLFSSIHGSSVILYLNNRSRGNDASSAVIINESGVTVLLTDLTANLTSKTNLAGQPKLLTKVVKTPEVTLTKENTYSGSCW
jgi:hypothetical protein